jgi:hypothetical protein
VLSAESVPSGSSVTAGLSGCDGGEGLRALGPFAPVPWTAPTVGGGARTGDGATSGDRHAAGIGLLRGDGEGHGVTGVCGRGSLCRVPAGALR